MVLTHKIQEKNSDAYQLRKKRIQKVFSQFSLYGITAAQYYPKGNVAIAEAMVQAGLKIIQYREKKPTTVQVIEELKLIREITVQSGVLLIVNDSVDLCKQVNADGVHLGQGDMPVEEARKYLGKEAIIGLSTHNQAQGLEAITTSADYIGVGPVFPTQTKPNEPTAGLDYVDFAVKHLAIPQVMIGGINESNCVEIAKLGGRTICMIRNLLEAKDMVKHAEKVNTLFSQAFPRT